MDAIAITEKNGIIVASTNNASFGMKKFKTFIDKAFNEAGSRYKILEESTLPKDFRTNRDFPEFNYLKVVFCRRQNKLNIESRARVNLVRLFLYYK